MLHSLKRTARNSSNGNTLHYAERLASSTVNSRFDILMFNTSNFCIFFINFLCDYTRHFRDRGGGGASRAIALPLLLLGFIS